MTDRKVYFIRHGESEANLGPYWGTDLPLTRKGVLQASRLQRELEGIPFSLVVSSDLKRAVATMLYAFPKKNSMMVDRRFREIYFGTLEGRLATDERIREIQKDISLNRTKYGGSDMFLRAREAIRALRDYINLCDGNIAVVGHDTLFECMFHLLGTDGEATEKEKGFLLWSNLRRMDNCQIREVDTKTILERDGAL